LSFTRTGDVLVIGAGIAGIQATVDLAEGGHRVHLVERRTAIGGTMPMLARTFPTNECSLCSLSPKLAECARHPNITIHTGAGLSRLDGEPGAFVATLELTPRWVDSSRCKACGDCAASCPVEVPDEFNQGLKMRSAVYQLYPQGFPKTYAIDTANCIECGVCVSACPAQAIDLSRAGEKLEVGVGAVILAPGFKPYNPAELRNLGYGRYRNVLTSLEFERVLSASGPSGGCLRCPGDDREPERIAWLQCVGSRNARIGRDYCSSVCCMAAVKGAMAAKEQARGALDAAIFYLDIRTHGKGYYRYYQRAVQEGVRFIAAGIDQVRENRDGSLTLRYLSPSGRITEETFDMVVLSVGMTPDPQAADLAGQLGLELNQDGFCARTGFGPLETNRPGIYTAGAIGGPCDIAWAVTEGSAAAGEVAEFLAGQRGTEEGHKEVAERDVRGENPRIGVFVCRCGTNIAGTVDVPAVTGFSISDPGVVKAEELTHACAPDGLEAIRQGVAEHGLNRVVVAACSPRSHKHLFQDAIRDCGLNRSLYEMANIRDHCAWVHQDDPEEATAKARRLVRMATAKARLLEPVDELNVAVTPVGLVVGGGASGMTAALSLADQGFEVHIVEREEALGGRTVAPLTSQLAGRCLGHPLVTVHLGQTVVSARGHVGDFRSLLKSGRELRHGVTVLACGSRELLPVDYLYGADPEVCTLGELESGPVPDLESRKTGSYVFIQCVGSRSADRPYCSRTCCRRSLEQALKLRMDDPDDPDAAVYVLYRDITTYGLHERLYEEARGAGVMFIRYSPEDAPQVERNGQTLRVLFRDPVLREVLSVEARVVLATATLPASGAAELAHAYKVPTDRDGFFLEAHTTLRPVEFSAQGIYMCGSCTGPKHTDEGIVQARAVGGRAGAVLARGVVKARGAYAKVDPVKCAACLNCVRVCPFDVPRLEGNASVIEPVQCQGCGICVAGCPNQAIHLLGYHREQLTALIQGLLTDQATVGQ